MPIEKQIGSSQGIGKSPDKPIEEKDWRINSAALQEAREEKRAGQPLEDENENIESDENLPDNNGVKIFNKNELKDLIDDAGEHGIKDPEAEEENS